MTEKKSIYGERIEESKNIIFNGFEEIFSNEELLDTFLNVMSKFDFSARDCLLVAEAMPFASNFATFNTWKDIGYRINKGEKGIAFIDYEKNTRKVWFDVSQTNAPQDVFPKEDTRTSREKLRSLLSNNRFRIIVVNQPDPTTNYTHGKPAYFDPEYKVIFIDRTSSFENLYPALATEIAHSYLWQALGNTYNREKYETTAQMAGCVTCKRNNITPNTLHISEEYKELGPYAVKTVLDNVRLVSDKIEDNIEYFYTNGKDKFQRPKPPPRRIKLDESKEEMQKNTKSNGRKSIRDFIKERKSRSPKGTDKYQPQHFKDNFNKNKGGKI